MDPGLDRDARTQAPSLQAKQRCLRNVPLRSFPPGVSRGHSACAILAQAVLAEDLGQAALSRIALALAGASVDNQVLATADVQRRMRAPVAARHLDTHAQRAYPAFRA